MTDMDGRQGAGQGIGFCIGQLLQAVARDDVEAVVQADGQCRAWFDQLHSSELDGAANDVNQLLAAYVSAIQQMELRRADVVRQMADIRHMEQKMNLYQASAGPH